MLTWNLKKAVGTKETASGSVGVYYCEGECLSTDTKPTGYIGNGSKLLEMDTSSLYLFDETSSTWMKWGDTT